MKAWGPSPTPHDEKVQEEFFSDILQVHIYQTGHFRITFGGQGIKTQARVQIT